MLVLLVLASCAAPGESTPGRSTPPGTTPSGTTAAGLVGAVRTGGFAGVRDTLVVQPDGRWRRTRRTAAAESGRLTGPQLEQLRRLAADPRLAAEAARTPPPTSCLDAFSYAVTVAGTTVDYIDCPTDPDRPEAAVALVRLLAGATRW
ncbi:MAG: hypothetical protein ACJ73E_01550 [Mycobacteriales bacterium]